MDLKAFVSESLVQIVEGVVASSARVAELGGAVSPAFDATPTADHIGTTTAEGRPVYTVDFDVALVVSADSQSADAERLSVAIATTGKRTAQSHKEEQLSRIRFSVPIQLPTDPTSKAAADDATSKRRQESQRQLSRLGARLGGY